MAQAGKCYTFRENKIAIVENHSSEKKTECFHDGILSQSI